MGLGRIASLLGSLAPTSGVEQVPSDAPLEDVAVSASKGADADRRNFDGKADMAAQIQQVLTAIEKLHETATEDGAGMAFSRSGASLRDAVGGLGHLLTAARDTREALPPELLSEASRVVGGIDHGLPAIQSAIQQRIDQMTPEAQNRVADTAARFLTEMHGAISRVMGALGAFR